MLPDTDYAAQDHDYADDETRMKVMMTLMMMQNMMVVMTALWLMHRSSCVELSLIHI